MLPIPAPYVKRHKPRMKIKNRIIGRAAASYVNRLTRAQKIARAELGCTAVAPVVLLPATRPMATRLTRALRKARRRGDTHRGVIGGRDVSVVNTGVGAPSAEGKVLACLGVGARVLLRVDICGGLRDDLAVGDAVVAERAVALDNTTRLAGGGEQVAASPMLLRTAAEAVRATGRPARYINGVVATVDTFHHQTDDMHRLWREKAAAVDMETSIIYHLARKSGAHALAVMAVSDVRAAAADPFGDGPFDYSALYQAFDELAAWAVEIVKRLPDPIPALDL
jgi:uridine phosphorylase